MQNYDTKQISFRNEYKIITCFARTTTFTYTKKKKAKHATNMFIHWLHYFVKNLKCNPFMARLSTTFSHNGTFNLILITLWFLRSLFLNQYLHIKFPHLVLCTQIFKHILKPRYLQQKSYPIKDEKRIKKAWYP